MTNLPHITKMKFGIIDEGYMNALSESSNEFEEMKSALQQIYRNQRIMEDTFIARISSRLPIAFAEPKGGQEEEDKKPMAWKYNWSRCEFSSLPIDIDLDNIVTSENYQVDGRYTQTSWAFREMVNSNLLWNPSDEDDEAVKEQGWAYNLAELSNILTLPYVFGIDIDSDDYPPEYEPQPCRMGSIVRLSAMLDFKGLHHYTFDRQGVHDGPCETLDEEPDDEPDEG